MVGAAAVIAVLPLGTLGVIAPSADVAGAGTSSPTVWLCRPGSASDPCRYSSEATEVEPNGSRSAASISDLPSPAAAAFDCFYVYPTVSDKEAGNTDLTVRKAEIVAAVDQASPFSRVCNVWAPMYRSQTLSSVAKGLAGDTSLLRSTFAVAYASLLSSWKAFLAQDDHGRPIVLIGDSQGSAILIHLISSRLDHEPTVLSRLVVAIIAGGNLQVPVGKTVGATFTHVPLCTVTTETGCAIAFSSYPSEPPTDSLFGRPGQGVSLQSGQTTRRGEQVACVNPAALGGGAADLDPYFLSVTQTSLRPSVSTPWVTYPDLYSARCVARGGATWLQVTDVAAASDSRPVVSEQLGPTWGYHAYDVNLALGNLLGDVAAQEAAWSATHG
jgi:hypothetical protein